MSKRKCQKANSKMFIKINDKEGIDRYLTKKILYISNFCISATDKVDIIQLLFKWYPSYTLSSKTIDMLLDIACNSYVTNHNLSSTLLSYN